MDKLAEFRKFFPTFNLGMEIPEGFEFNPLRLRILGQPCFENAELDLSFMVEDADPQERLFKESQRFFMVTMTNGRIDGDNSTLVCETEEIDTLLNEIEAVRIAKADQSIYPQPPK
jgi:hypothetical protein